MGTAGQAHRQLAYVRLAQARGISSVRHEDGESFKADALDRLARRGAVLPALGQELAAARREAARLRIENRQLRRSLSESEAGSVT
jgi:hypothetical protein